MSLLLSVEFVKETCCTCGIAFALEKRFYEVLVEKKESGSFYCPNGHGQHYVGKSLDQQIADLKWTVQNRDNLLHEKRLEIARLEKRVQKGVCLYCKRTFPNLAKHIACKHKAK